MKIALATLRHRRSSCRDSFDLAPGVEDGCGQCASAKGPLPGRRRSRWTAGTGSAFGCTRDRDRAFDVVAVCGGCAQCHTADLARAGLRLSRRRQLVPSGPPPNRPDGAARKVRIVYTQAASYGESGPLIDVIGGSAERAPLRCTNYVDENYIVFRAGWHCSTLPCMDPILAGSGNSFVERCGSPRGSLISRSRQGATP